MGQMFELINTMQILYYLPLISVDFTVILEILFQIFGFAFFNIQIPYISSPDSTFMNYVFKNEDF